MWLLVFVISHKSSDLSYSGFVQVVVKWRTHGIQSTNFGSWKWNGMLFGPFLNMEWNVWSISQHGMECCLVHFSTWKGENQNRVSQNNLVFVLIICL